MFNKEIYIKRREKLIRKFIDGIILIPGNKEKPINYASNIFKFRQDSTFLYFAGINLPDLFLIVDIGKNETILYGNDYYEDDFIWSGKKDKLEYFASLSGINKIKSLSDLKNDIDYYINKKASIHFLPPYSDDIILELSYLFNCQPEKIVSSFSMDLINAIFELRSIKEEIEIFEIENTISNITGNFFLEIMKSIKKCRKESEVRAIIDKTVIENNSSLSFEPTCSIHGEILHNPDYTNALNKSQLLLIDAGADSKEFYATDITRTIPISGKFSSIQKDIYNIVLKSQLDAIKSIFPGIKYYEIHMIACKTIVEGLISLNLMKGNPEDIINEGAHALFMPHGIGHLLGLDVHDMENFGENLIGYDNETVRSNHFGTKYLRFAKKLLPGYILTVEPGIYFIPYLIEGWYKEKKFNKFINYSNLEKYIDFGGIRIEDDVLVTPDGAKILGNPIPKTIEKIESIIE